MSEEYKLDCEKAKEQLDMLIDLMVEERLKQAQNKSLDATNLASGSFEPQGALKNHLADCTQCHNYHLANQVLIEAAKALPRLEADEDFTQSIMAMIEVEQNSQNTIAPQNTHVPSFFARHNNIFLVASFIAFTLITSGVFADNAPLADGAASSDWIWSTGSWALALLVVALLKPFIEGNGSSAGQSRTAKA